MLSVVVNLPRGTVVRVMPGRFVPDGYEGIYTVIRPMSDLRGDYYLARGVVVNPEDADWDLIAHVQRFQVGPVIG